MRFLSKIRERQFAKNGEVLITSQGRFLLVCWLLGV